MAHVEHTQKMIPLISRETCFGQNVCELVSGVNMFDLDLGFQIHSIKQPIKTLWVLDTCLITILIKASLSSKMQLRLSWRRMSGARLNQARPSWAHLCHQVRPWPTWARFGWGIGDFGQGYVSAGVSLEGPGLQKHHQKTQR